MTTGETVLTGDRLDPVDAFDWDCAGSDDVEDWFNVDDWERLCRDCEPGSVVVAVVVVGPEMDR